MSGAKTLNEYFSKYSDNSYIKQLLPDPETEKYAPNKKSRPVKLGHYVLVKSTPIKDPYMIMYSRNLANELKISDSIMNSDDMLKLLSAVPLNSPTWVTPYSLSIYGKEIYDNCPFKNDTGYGDGRCISVAEFLINNKKYEFQLKGSGTTPFSRSGDGRAILRSSIREYIVSEAMHNLNVSTTRALSLVVSNSEKVNRMWYKNTENDEPSIAHKNEIMTPNKVAIVCRVAPSFIRVGTIELFSRRARTSKQINELNLMFRHVLFREYPEFYKYPLDDAIIATLKEFRNRISIMVADWLRVGYIQGNFNSDNCSIAGNRTLDYGPFGFMELYRDRNPWSEGGTHFNFFNQPKAAKMNFFSFANALKPLLSSTKHNEIDKLVDGFDDVCNNIVNKMWAQKLGLSWENWNNGISELFNKLNQSMLKYQADYTMFWRQLVDYPIFLKTHSKITTNHLGRAFYDKNLESFDKDWMEWLYEYGGLLLKENKNPQMVSMNMKLFSPKYIPREFMLVEAYTKAENGDYESVKILEAVLSKPYDEQPEFESLFYTLTPLETVTKKAGTAYMTCAS